MAFADLFARENGLSAVEGQKRKRQLAKLIDRVGSYDHSQEELTFGARVAWRNHARCIGRLHWKSLEVIDCRHLSEADAIAAQLIDHLRFAFSDGRIRSVISIFAPVTDTSTPCYVENAQIVQFAGYPQEDGSILGDPLNVEFTRMAISLGWRPRSGQSAFDVLPLVIRDQNGRRLAYEIPEDAHHIVKIDHVALDQVTDHDLKWYALPVVSDMILTIGGIDYPCAPFNGYYMSTEIACRNYTDKNRYNVLSTPGDELTGERGGTLAKDRLLLSLNEAVIESFASAGVRMVDHHTASRQYMEFAQHEHAAGRVPSGDWAWIVPPLSPTLCPVFHLPMTDLGDVPNFYRSRSSDGQALSLSRHTEYRNGPQRTWEQFKRRLRAWRRTRYL